MYQSKNVLNTLSGHVVYLDEVRLCAEYGWFWFGVDERDDECVVVAKPFSCYVSDVALFLTGDDEHVAFVGSVVLWYVHDGVSVFFVDGGEYGGLVYDGELVVYDSSYERACPVRARDAYDHMCKIIYDLMHTYDAHI